MKKSSWGDAQVSRDYESAPGTENVFEVSEPTTKLVSDVDVVKIEPVVEVKKESEVKNPKAEPGAAVVKAKYLMRLPDKGDLVFFNLADRKDVRLVVFSKENYTSVVEFSAAFWATLEDASKLESVIEALKWFN